MKASKIITFCYLRSQGIKLLRWRLGYVPCGHPLPLAKGVHDFHARDRTARRPKRLETEHGTNESFHRSMVLLYDIIEILGVTNNDGRLMRLVVALGCRRVRPTPVDSDLLRESLLTNSLA
jgi:hypothetical protein